MMRTLIAIAVVAIAFVAEAQMIYSSGGCPSGRCYMPGTTYTAPSSSRWRAARPQTSRPSQTVPYFPGSRATVVTPKKTTTPATKPIPDPKPKPLVPVKPSERDKLVAEVVAQAVAEIKVEGLQGPQGERGPQGPQGPPGKLSEADKLEIVQAVIKELPPMPPGREGPPGPPGDAANIDAVVQAVLAELPPIVLVSADESQEFWSAEVHLGDTVRLPGIEFQHYTWVPVIDANGNVVVNDDGQVQYKSRFDRTGRVCLADAFRINDFPLESVKRMIEQEVQEALDNQSE